MKYNQEIKSLFIDIPSQVNYAWVNQAIHQLFIIFIFIFTLMNNAPIFKGIQFDNFEFLISQYILSKDGYQ